VQRFVSKVVNKLDAKGRVSVPAQFRQVLASQNTDGFYCIRSVAHPALNGFGDTLFDQADVQLNNLNPIFSQDFAAQATAIFGQAKLLGFDDEGRVRLPDDLIAYAGIQDRVLFVGLNRIFEIWNPDTFEPIERERLERMQQVYRTGGVA
jgi:MraZ protein